MPLKSKNKTNTKKPAKLKINTGRRGRFLGMASAGVLFAAVGVYFLSQSFAAAADFYSIEAESLQTSSLPTGASIIADAKASAGKALKLTKNSTVSGSFSLSQASTSITIYARDNCKGSPSNLVLTLDSRKVASLSVGSTNWKQLKISAG